MLPEDHKSRHYTGCSILSTMTSTNPPMEGALQCLDATYVSECAKVMAHAFSNSPAYTFIFQGSQEYRQEAIEWVLEQNIHLMLTKCPTVLRGWVDTTNSTNSGRVLCCFLWVPGEAAKLSTWDLVVTGGMWKLPLRYGISTLLRLLSFLDQMKSVKGQISSSDSTPIVLLQRMVVHPDYQGKGIGTLALKTILQQSGGQQNIYLDTQEERNVVFYQRLGWQVEHEKDYFPEDPIYRFHSWSMVRKSNSSSE